MQVINYCMYVAYQQYVMNSLLLLLYMYNSIALVRLQGAGIKQQIIKR
jgi:hypothetical protein